MTREEMSMSQQLAALIGQYPTGIGQHLGVATDNRPIRLRLTERLQRNQDEINRLTGVNDDIRALLSDLDEHPIMERINDAVKRILG